MAKQFSAYQNATPVVEALAQVAAYSHSHKLDA